MAASLPQQVIVRKVPCIQYYSSAVDTRIGDTWLELSVPLICLLAGGAGQLTLVPSHQKKKRKGKGKGNKDKSIIILLINGGFLKKHN